MKTESVVFGILTFAIIGIVLISGCITEDNRSSKLNQETKSVTCNPPYIEVGTSCCLDQNSNNICDKDEPKENINLELMSNSVELNIIRNEAYYGTDTKSVILRNSGNKEVEYGILCNTDRFNPGGYGSYNNYVTKIPDHFLRMFIMCSHNNKWIDTISPGSTHSIDISYDSVGNSQNSDNTGTYTSKLLIVVLENDYSIEIPIKINIK